MWVSLGKFDDEWSLWKSLAKAEIYFRWLRKAQEGHYSWRISAGQKLLMSALKDRYGLGVGPLREALSQLVAEHPGHCD